MLKWAGSSDVGALCVSRDKPVLHSSEVFCLKEACAVWQAEGIGLDAGLTLPHGLTAHQIYQVMVLLFSHGDFSHW